MIEKSIEETVLEKISVYVSGTEFESELRNYIEIVINENNNDESKIFERVFDFFNENIPNDIKQKILKDIDDML